MITIVSVPKPFCGHIGSIQGNAVESWRVSLPGAQILLLGDESGVAEAADVADAEHIPDLQLSRWGTPLLSSAFERATEVARHDVMAFVNADVILPTDLDEVIGSLPGPPFLVVGQCRDVEVEGRLSMGAPEVQADLTRRWRQGRSRGPLAMDYFVLSLGLFDPLPPFVVGRACYDNWMVWRALDRGASVIDASDRVVALHQIHDYGHVRGGLRETRSGVEARNNRGLAGWQRYLHLHSILDCTHVLDERGLKPAPLRGWAFLRQLWLRLGLRMSGR